MGFLSALLFLSAFSACSLREVYDLNESENFSERIEFVARPVGFNNINVSTKADASTMDPIEDVIYNLYFLLFENSTDSGRLIKYESLNPSSPNVGMKTDKGLTNAFVCFFANVDSDFVSNIKTVGDLKSAIYNIKTYTVSGNRLGVPVIKVGEQAVACLPMFESASVDMTGAAGTIKTITLRRLFAKAIVNLKVNIPNDNSTTYILKKCTLTNLPTNVAITTPSTENTWVSKPNEEKSGETTTTYFVNPESISLNSHLVSGHETPYQIVCYIPEYKVTPEIPASEVEGYDSSKDAQIYKPLLCPNKRPAYITLEGDMGTNIYNHKIFLGEDNHSNFNLQRNTQYTNNITITGTSEASVDHRVSFTTMPTMLVNGEAANCYIINAPGKYQLDTYQGVCKNLSTYTPLKGYPFIVASDGKVSLQLWNSGTYDDKIIMDVGNTGTLGQYLSILTSGGNAVVGLNSKDDATGEWLWTWHLWFSIEVGDLLSIDTQEYSSSTSLMDRNMGALPSSTTELTMPGTTQGLTYRYGHRSPYFSSVNYPNATNYPGYKSSDVKTWTVVKEATYTVTNSSGEVITKTNYKSEMDPCPAGYRVPPEGTWGDGGSHPYSTIGYFLYSGIIFYPYTAGYTTPTKDIIATGYERKTTQEKNGSETPGGWSYPKTRTQTRTEIVFYDVEYSAPMVCYRGDVWSSSSKTFCYDYNLVDFTNFRKMIKDMSINKYMEKRRSVEVKQKKSSPLASWKDDPAPKESDWSDWTEGIPVEYSYSFGDTWPAEMLYEELKKEDAGIYFSTSSYETQTNSEARFQLRCLKE